jgi:hypothetical protein
MRCPRRPKGIAGRSETVASLISARMAPSSRGVWRRGVLQVAACLKAVVERHERAEQKDASSEAAC